MLTQFYNASIFMFHALASSLLVITTHHLVVAEIPTKPCRRVQSQQALPPANRARVNQHPSLQHAGQMVFGQEIVFH